MKETYERFEDLAVKDPSSGIKFLPGVEWFDTPSTSYTDLAPEAKYSSWPEFRELKKDELPEDVKWGVTYRTWAVNSPVYLAWLLREVKLRGGKFLRQSLSAIEEALFLARSSPEEHIEAIINCSGMGFNDPNTFPSRGQTLVIANPFDKTITHQAADGTWNFIIPRPLSGGTIIGGTKEVGNWYVYLFSGLTIP
jgi:D-amino-acid oxidase